MNSLPKVCGLILAGGQSKRITCSDKSLAPIGETTMLAHVVKRLKPQVEALVISASQTNQANLKKFGLPLVIDETKQSLGPIAGIYAAIKSYARHYDWLISVSCDTPFIPPDLVSALYDTAMKNSSAITFAKTASRSHYALALWSTALLPKIEQQLQHNDFALKHFFRMQNAATTVFSNEESFFNVNSDADLAKAEALLKKGGL